MRAVKEKDPKNKDKYNIKYLTLTEVPEELVTSGVLFDEASGNSTLLNKCDAIIYIFESNDSEQVDFVKKAATPDSSICSCNFVTFFPVPEDDLKALI